MTVFSHKLIHNSTTQSKASRSIRPQMTATFHTYRRLLHHTEYARSRWCVVQFTPLGPSPRFSSRAAKNQKGGPHF